MEKYVVLEKKVGQTPLQCVEAYKEEHLELAELPMAYAGRLDPMASGKLLVLIGDECKKQEEYHNLDKEYEFSVLFGVQSDTADVLGLVRTCTVPELSTREIRRSLRKYTGTIQLPYPHFSSKTVQGKPLHTWTLEGRLNEIEIPIKKSKVYSLKLLGTETIPAQDVYTYAIEKINTIAPVTDPRKALGKDFRRDDIRKAWAAFRQNAEANFTIAHFRCTASSGTYMRTLAESISKELGTCGLAYTIHRTTIGRYYKVPLIGFGKWLKIYQ